MLCHVVAMAENRVIGKGNKLPWHFPSDLKQFKALTMGGTLIMGRKTFESIGKPLPGRENFVISRSAHPEIPGVRFFSSIQDALKQAKTEKVFIIGGAQIFSQTVSLVDGVYLTEISAEFDGDVSYPPLPAHFKERERITLQEAPKIDFVFYENTSKRAAAETKKSAF